MTNWEEKAKRDAVQSGKGPGEFGPDYSERKKYQLGYGNESPSPILKELLVNTHRNPRQSPYENHVIEPYDINRKIKREGTPPLTKEEIEWRHEQLRKKQVADSLHQLHDSVNEWKDRKKDYE